MTFPQEMLYPADNLYRQLQTAIMLNTCSRLLMKRKFMVFYTNIKHFNEIRRSDSLRRTSFCQEVSKENQVRMWDNREYELVIPGCPTVTLRARVGHPGIISEYSWLSHILTWFSFYYMPKIMLKLQGNMHL